MTFSNTKPGARSNGVADELLKPFETYHWIRDSRLLPKKKKKKKGDSLIHTLSKDLFRYHLLLKTKNIVAK